jgi:hypothetical protein
MSTRLMNYATVSAGIPVAPPSTLSSAYQETGHVHAYGLRLSSQVFAGANFFGKESVAWGCLAPEFIRLPRILWEV